jgi:starvation-inducible DNA-binding protein
MRTIKSNDLSHDLAQPALHQQAQQVQDYDVVIKEIPLGLSVLVRQEVVDQFNQVVADTMTIRDLYKKSHWQVSGATFYQLHLLFDKHYAEQVELVDILAERIQVLGGISIAMAHDVADRTNIDRPPLGREEVPVLLSRLLEAHEVIVQEVRSIAKRVSSLGDEGSNDILISNVLRTNELQIWFLYEHLVNMPLVVAKKD